MGAVTEPHVAEGDRRRKAVGADQVVPVLKTQSRLVHDIVGKDRRNGKIRDLELIGGEVTGSEIALALGLIVQAVVSLGGVAQVGAVPGIEPVIDASVVAGIEIRRGNGLCYLGRSQSS